MNAFVCRPVLGIGAFIGMREHTPATLLVLICYGKFARKEVASSEKPDRADIARERGLRMGT